MRHGTFVCVALALILTAGAGNLKGDSGKQAANATIDRLIKQLGDDNFAKREAASKELDGIGEPGLAALRQTVASTNDAEVRSRAERLVRAITGRLHAAITKRELEKLQGTWFLVSYETNGQRIKGEDKTHVFIFRGDKWSLQTAGQVFQAGTVKRIEVKDKLNAIDLPITQGSSIGATASSIYAIEGDLLKYLNCGEPRATDFITKPGDGRNYLSLRRAVEAGKR